MKNLKYGMFCLLGLTLTHASFAQDNKVVYGEDDRIEFYQYKRSSDSGLKKSHLRAVAAMIPNRAIKKKNVFNYQIEAKTLGVARKLCEGEKFGKQITAANCTGFLIGKNKLVTAGHCVQNQSDCESAKWVFGYKQGRGDKIRNIPQWRVFSCKKIIKTVLDRNTMDDFAVLELDRNVWGIRPLKIRKSGKVEKSQRVVVVGHPSGLPLKIAGGAIVRDNDNPFYFGSNLDTFGGNSGSPVFNYKTGIVEGILVRGERDYKYDFQNQCYAVNRCTDSGCRGEDVTRITNLVKAGLNI